MITATQARELVQGSDVVLEGHMAAISTIIEQAAKLGKNTILLDDVYPTVFKATTSQFERPRMDGLSGRIIEQLKANGFIVDLDYKEHTFGGGLGSMDEYPYREMRYHLRVQW